MFYSVRGRLVFADPTVAAVECGGVAYKCFISRNTARALPRLGEEVLLYTYLSVREDAMDLYGFAEQGECECFKILIGVSGVGAKVALAILSELSAARVAACISMGDSKSLTRASGVGPKLAQRIVLELKDKFKGMDTMPSEGSAPVDAGILSASNNAQEAITALTVLGYSTSEATEIVCKLDSSLPVEALIGQALKMLGRQR